ncbi:sensor histidine kinase [Micromonospora zhanjiangensis]
MSYRDAWPAIAAGVALTAAGVPALAVALGGDLTWAGVGALTATLTVLLLAAPRWPLAVLLTSVGVTVGYRTAHLADVGWVWPATAAFVAAVLVRPAWACLVGAVTLAFAANWEWTVDGHPAAWVAGHLGAETLWLVAVLSAATAVRDQRRWRTEAAARHLAALREAEADAARRRAEERVRIARELHDLVSHTLAVVGVHLNVALDALDVAPDETRAALHLAQRVRGGAMADLNALLAVLRDENATDVRPPVARLDTLTDMVQRVRASGLAVTLHETGDRQVVSGPVALAVCRIVQESLTNAVRHAAGSRAEVVLRYGPDRVEVTIHDDGGDASGPAAGAAGDTRGGDPGGAGHGIAGMRERAAALGGRLTAGPVEAGGFAVHAVLPVTGPPR